MVSDCNKVLSDVEPDFAYPEVHTRIVKNGLLSRRPGKLTLIARLICR